MPMTESRTLAESQGVTVTQRSVYHYNGHTYDNLSDALNYAELVRSRATVLPVQESAEHARADRG
jgi:hypothetical protein